MNVAGNANAKITVNMDASNAQKSIDQIIAGCKRASCSLAQLGKSVSDEISALLSRIAEGSEKAGSALIQMGKRAASGIGTLLKFSTSNGLLRNLFSKFCNVLKEGMSTLAQYDSETRKTLNGLSSSLTMVKASLAAAFLPILTTVAPLLTMLCDMLVTAANYIAMFFAALTGGGYKKIVANQNKYNKSLKAGSGAAKKLVNNLSGLDEIHLWQEPTGGSGGGGGGGGGGSDSAFKTVLSDIALPDWAKLMVDQLKAADWAGAAKTLTELLNKMITRVNWAAVGDKIGYWLNAALTFLAAAIITFDWQRLGFELATGINISYMRWIGLIWEQCCQASFRQFS